MPAAFFNIAKAIASFSLFNPEPSTATATVANGELRSFLKSPPKYLDGSDLQSVEETFKDDAKEDKSDKEIPVPTTAHLDPENHVETKC